MPYNGVDWSYHVFLLLTLCVCECVGVCANVCVCECVGVLVITIYSLYECSALSCCLPNSSIICGVFVSSHTLPGTSLLSTDHL